MQGLDDVMQSVIHMDLVFSLVVTLEGFLVVKALSKVLPSSNMT